MSALFRLLALLAALSLVACTTPAQRDEATTDAEAAELESEPSAETLPAQELTEPVLYEMLLGEIALQRGDAALAAQTFADLAQRTRDPRVARRAVEVANIARTPQLALQAARVWHEADPASVQALQTVAALLVPVLAGAFLVHWPNGWSFTAPGGGWEYVAFLLIALVAQILLGDGALSAATLLRRGTTASTDGSPALSVPCPLPSSTSR